MIIRSFILGLSLGFCLLASASHAELIKEGGPSETYLCGEPDIYAAYRYREDVLAERRQNMVRQPMLFTRDASGADLSGFRGLGLVASLYYPNGSWKQDVYANDSNIIFFTSYLGSGSHDKELLFPRLDWLYRCYMQK